MKDYWNRKSHIVISIDDNIPPKDVGFNGNKFKQVCKACGKKLDKNNRHKLHPSWCKECYGC